MAADHFLLTCWVVSNQSYSYIIFRKLKADGGKSDPSLFPDHSFSVEQRKQSAIDTCMKQIAFILKYSLAGMKMNPEAYTNFIMASVFSLRHRAALQCYVPFSYFKERRDNCKYKLNFFFFEVKSPRLFSSEIKKV